MSKQHPKSPSLGRTWSTMCIDPKSLEPETRKPLHANACSSALQSKVQIFDRHRAGPRSTVDRQYQARGPRLLSTAAETVRLDSGDLGCSDPRLPCVWVGCDVMHYGIGLRVRVVKMHGKESSSSFSLGKLCWAGAAFFSL